PSVSGAMVPEPVFTRAGYQALLEGIYRDLAPLDPAGTLRHEWVNARGCIARFDRGTIEIRVIDAQECAAADVAVCAAVSAAVRALTEERFASQKAQRAWPEERLAAILDDTIESADRAVVRDAEYLRCLGWPGRAPCTGGELWSHLVAETIAREERAREWMPALETILREGCLARRILGALSRERGAGEEIPRPELHEVYGALARCVAAGERFAG
ncbi:MAG: glutamate--cysteine ligase, partial [bacterium]